MWHFIETQKGIIKSDVSNNFPIFVSLCFPSKTQKEYQKITIHKRVIHDTKPIAFKTGLRSVNWNSINHSLGTNSKYETFLKYSLSYTKNTFP